MTNTTRYRMETPGGEVRFDAYFNADGSVSSSEKTIRGFWNTVERKGMEFFCYALDGIPAKPSQLVECFPIAAMAIPRLADPLWTSKPTEGVILIGLPYPALTLSLDLRQDTSALRRDPLPPARDSRTRFEREGGGRASRRSYGLPDGADALADGGPG